MLLMETHAYPQCTINLSKIQTIIPKADCKVLLNILEASLEDFEYFTPIMFTAMLDVCIDSYLRGKGMKIRSAAKADERQEILSLSLNNLIEFSINVEGYGWFLEMLDRVQDMSVEQETLDG